jgi:hypothetical protein
MQAKQLNCQCCKTETCKGSPAACAVVNLDITGEEMRKNMKSDAARSLEKVEDMNDDPAIWLFRFIERETVRRPSAFLAQWVRFGYIVNNVCTVLQFLGLAKDDDGEWVPTCCLKSIIAEQPARLSLRDGKDKMTKDDRDFLAAVYYLATGLPEDEKKGDEDEDQDEDEDEDDDYECDSDPSDWSWNLLVAFGLLERAKGKGRAGFKPTPRMKELVLKSLLECAIKEKTGADAEIE